MIDLAPGHKQGLLVENPVLIAAGAVGCGEAHWPELALHTLGAVIVGPVTLQSRAGAPMPRLVETTAGMLLETGSQNRGLAATLRAYAPLWGRLGIPVVVQLADARPEALARCCAQLSGVPGVSAVEWRAPHGSAPEGLRRGVEVMSRAGDLPLWVKLPQRTDGELEALAAAAVESGACGLVIGSPPLGAALIEGDAAWLLQGGLYGPALWPGNLHALASIAALALPVALIACGGIHTAGQARAALAAGARAMQLDAVAWIEPAFPALLAHVLKEQG